MHGLAAVLARETKYIGVGVKVRAVCPNCGTGAEFKAESVRKVWPSLGSDRQQYEGFTPAGGASLARRLLTENDWVEEQVWRCSYCARTTMLVVHHEGGGVDHTVTHSEVWPERVPRELPQETPEDMRSLYREASVAENAGALRGAAGLYRAAVEALVEDQGLASGNLGQRIDALVDKGVEPDLVRDLHEARLTGNWSLHDGVSFSPDEIADVAQLLQDAVRLLYVQPAEKERMREARAARRSPKAN